MKNNHYANILIQFENLIIKILLNAQKDKQLNKNYLTRLEQFKIFQHIVKKNFYHLINENKVISKDMIFDMIEFFCIKDLILFSDNINKNNFFKNIKYIYNYVDSIIKYVK